MKIKKIRAAQAGVCLLALLLLAGCRKSPSIEKAIMVAEWSETQEDAQGPVQNNPYTDLSVSTYITKIKDDYFIVDCYHDQVIYHDNLTDDLSEWKVMTSQMSRGHTIVSDGVVYLVDDTENHRILVFEKRGDRFFQTQVLSDIGTRPHFLDYDEKSKTFYAWSSMTGEMYLIHRNETDNRMYVSDVKQIEKLNGVYVRSFTIAGDDIYFVSGTASIIRADLKTFRIREEYPVPEELAGMIQLVPIEDAYYITISTDAAGSQEAATIIRTEDLHGLAEGDYEDIYHYFVGGGTPYYMTRFDGAWYLTEHRVPGHSIWRFEVRDGLPDRVEAVY